MSGAWIEAARQQVRVTYSEEMAIIHDEHCHVVEQKKTGDSGMKNNGKGLGPHLESFVRREVRQLIYNVLVGAFSLGS
jgi:hypothetical protein